MMLAKLRVERDAQQVSAVASSASYYSARRRATLALPRGPSKRAAVLSTVYIAFVSAAISGGSPLPYNLVPAGYRNQRLGRGRSNGLLKDVVGRRPLRCGLKEAQVRCGIPLETEKSSPLLPTDHPGPPGTTGAINMGPGNVTSCHMVAELIGDLASDPRLPVGLELDDEPQRLIIELRASNEIGALLNRPDMHIGRDLA